jgi:hypothetical protein
MYFGVPAIMPLCVIVASSVAWASPKSVIVTRSIQKDIGGLDIAVH